MSGTRKSETDAQPYLDPPLTLYLDESGNGNAGQPLIVGAVACDGYTIDPEEQIQAFYRELKSRSSLVGLPSFEAFVKDGFHASENPPEVVGAFREMVLQELHFKLYMITTDRSCMAPLPEPEQIKEMYAKLITDIVLSARRRVSVHCIFEQNHELRDFIRDLPAIVLQRASKNSAASLRIPPVTVQMKPKMDSMSIAVIDFAMLAVSKWIRSDRVLDPTKRDYRAFREVEPMISLLYSLESGVISSRSRPLH
jgi:hypothetical protein